MMEEIATPAAVRRIERTGELGELWSALSESGFLDALTPEDAGGFDLSLREVEPLFELVGRHAAPAPISHTMAARALLADAGRTSPSGPIVLAAAYGEVARQVPLAAVAEHALIDNGLELRLVRLQRGEPSKAAQVGLAEEVSWCDGEAITSAAAGQLLQLCAVLEAADMAGAADRVLEMTSAYAIERVQFGKPIAKQQAVQQLLALLAEKVVMTRVAARLGCDCRRAPRATVAAMAKAVASAAAAEIAAIAHAVHGAIGITEEHDLHLYTRRLQDARYAHGGEAFWSERLGRIRLASDATTSVDFIRTSLTPAGPELV